MCASRPIIVGDDWEEQYEKFCTPHCQACKTMLALWLGNAASNERLLEVEHHRTMRDLNLAVSAGCGICSQLIDALRVHGLTMSYFPKGPRLLVDVLPRKLLFAIRPGRYLLRLQACVISADEMDDWQSSMNLSSEQTGETSVLQRAQSWITGCLSDHDSCRKVAGQVGGNHPGVSDTSAVYRPPRLIMISKDRIKLCEAQEADFDGRYMTLSYCWGRKPLHMTLTSYNIDQLRAGVAISALAKTFQDAIHVAATLGINYIWIDALCILQDGPGSQLDWQNHVLEMRKIYSNGFVNLASDHGQDADSGCFVPRDPLSVRPSLLRYSRPTSTSSTGKDQSVVPEGALIQFRQATFDREGLANSPLMQRAWVTQERILSLRVLHFGRRQISWECEGSRVCETTPFTGSATIAIDDAFNRASGIGAIAWGDILTLYTTTSCTRPEDKLPAIAGIAQLMPTYLQSQYVAGLLRDELVKGRSWLLWSRTHELVSGPIKPLVRFMSPYVAPTWSWASCQGPINFRYHADIALSEVENVFIDLIDPRNPFGQVKAAHLDIITTIIPMIGDFDWITQGLQAWRMLDVDVYTADQKRIRANLLFDAVELDLELPRLKLATIVASRWEVLGLLLLPAYIFGSESWVRRGIFRIYLDPKKSPNIDNFKMVIQKMPKTKLRIV